MHFAWFGSIDAKHAGIEFERVRAPLGNLPSVSGSRTEGTPAAGWIAINVNLLYGYHDLGAGHDDYAWLREFQPVARTGYSIIVFHP